MLLFFIDAIKYLNSEFHFFIFVEQTNNKINEVGFI